MNLHPIREGFESTTITSVLVYIIWPIILLILAFMFIKWLSS